MKKNIFIYILIFSFTIPSFSQTKDTAKTDDFMQYKCIVMAAQSYNFPELDKIAKEISKKTGIPYDNGNMIYDKELGMIFPKDTAKYGIDAGQSMLRRYDENRISIEMMHFYNSEDRQQMVIITGIFDIKKQQEAEKQLQFIHDFSPLHEILITQLYMGCMH